MVRAGLGTSSLQRLQRAIPGLREPRRLPPPGNRAFVSADGRTTYVLAYPGHPTAESFGMNTRAAKA